MKTFRQMLRKPVKTFVGIVLLAAATAALIICVGQAVSAYDTEKTIYESFTTAALPTMHYQYDQDALFRVNSLELPEDIRVWLNETVATHLDIVKQISKPGLASAYVPALTPHNYTQYIITNDGYEAHSWEPNPDGTPYRELSYHSLLIANTYSSRRNGCDDVINRRSKNIYIRICPHVRHRSERGAPADRPASDGLC